MFKSYIFGRRPNRQLTLPAYHPKRFHLPGYRRSRSFLFLLSLAIASLLSTRNASAQERSNEIDKIFSWASNSTPGCACAVSQNGQLLFSRGYGSADLERNVAITPGSVFDAGSLTKQFVAAATLLLVEDGKLLLTDDVRKYIPELPDYGHKITIDHLLTHTSGIRDWTGILPLSGVKTDALTITLRQRALNFKPGDEWGYSNSGFVLLKEIVARISKMPFGEFVQKRLFDTLGMKSTSYRHNLRDIIKNRALAYDDDNGRWQMAMLLDDDRGGGGALLSTATDLLIWNDALTNNRLGRFVSDKLAEPATLNNGRKLNYGRGLLIDSYRGTKEIWHTGSADGYKSWLGRYPEHGLSIAIMCNSGDGTDRTSFAHRLFDLFVPANGTQKAESTVPPPIADTAGMNLSNRVGVYINEKTGEPLQLALDRGRFRIAGGPGLVPITKDRFKRFGAFVQFMSQDEFQLQFLPNGALELISMEGQTTRYRRANAYSPSDADLKSLEGKYESDELGTVLLVTAGKDGLLASLAHTPERKSALKPIDTDAFQFSRVVIRFIRDKNGKVTGLDFSNPFVRNVRLRKL